MTACFTLNGKEYCIHYAIREIPFPIPPIEFSKPDPWPAAPAPWLKGFGISPEVAFDLSILAGIDVLVKTLQTPRLQKQFTQSVHDAITHCDLPKGVSVNFDDQQGIHKSECHA